MKMKQDRNEGIGTTVLKPIVAGHKRTRESLKMYSRGSLKVFGPVNISEVSTFCRIWLSFDGDQDVLFMK